MKTQYIKICGKQVKPFIKDIYSFKCLYKKNRKVQNQYTELSK